MSSLPSGPDRTSAEHIAEFEAMYEGGREPFDYGQRAVESLRHELVAATAVRLEPARVLDLGCGLGQITGLLLGRVPALVAMDLSRTAVARAADRLRAGGHPIPFLAGSALALPFCAGSFDLVIASDGLVSWHLSPQQRAAALSEIGRVLRPGGTVLLTEYLREPQFDAFVAEVVAARLEPFLVRAVTDRLWYWFESWIKAFHRSAPGRALRASRLWARALVAAGRPLGRRGARHVLVLARHPQA